MRKKYPQLYDTCHKDNDKKVIASREIALEIVSSGEKSSLSRGCSLHTVFKVWDKEVLRSFNLVKVWEK